MHIYQGPNGEADTQPDQLYEYSEVVADSPEDSIEDTGTLEELAGRYMILSFLRNDTSLLYEPVILSLTIGLITFTLHPIDWT